MHDGSIPTLDEVIDYYDRGGNRHPLIDPEIRPLHLAPDERRQLRAFLEALVGKVLAATQPILPLSGKAVAMRKLPVDQEARVASPRHSNPVLAGAPRLRPSR